MIFLDNLSGEIQSYDVNTGVVSVFEDKSRLPALFGEKKAYTREFGQIVASLVAQGESVKSACSKKFMPSYALVVTWLNQFPKFNDLVDLASNSRAKRLEDEIADLIQDLEEVDDKTKVSAIKLKLDVLKWLCQINNPTKYLPKAENNNEIGAVNITIVTGIPSTERELKDIEIPLHAIEH